MTNVLKQLVPTWVYRLKHQYNHRRFHNRSNTSIFSEIYNSHLWGGETDPFCSGDGTVDENAYLYLDKLHDFFLKTPVKSVVEIGCGDYRLMRGIIEQSNLRYTGVDVVPDLIDHLNKNHASETVKFICADAVTSDLPVADVCIIRQVLQHLSNDQIMSILVKLKQYRYVIITEHVPLGRNVVPNKDKKSGPDIRIYFNSGVFLEHPPFNQKADILIEYRADHIVFHKNQPAVLRTYLIKN